MYFWFIYKIYGLIYRFGDNSPYFRNQFANPPTVLSLADKIFLPVFSDCSQYVIKSCARQAMSLMVLRKSIFY